MNDYEIVYQTYLNEELNNGCTEVVARKNAFGRTLEYIETQSKIVVPERRECDDCDITGTRSITDIFRGNCELSKLHGEEE